MGRRRLGVLAAVGGVSLALLTGGAQAGAATLDGGCSGQATSVDEGGATIDQMQAPGPGGTRKDPFEVDYDSVVNYAGSGPVITDHSWDVKVFGITVQSGGSENGSRLNSTSGEAVVKDYLPFRFTGLYHVSGGISGNGGTCSGSAWVKLTGSPVGTIPWLGGIGFTGLGALFAFLTRPGLKAGV